MTDHMTPAPGQATPPPLDTLTQTATYAISADDGTFVALIGGIVGSVLLLLVCLMTVLLCCMSRHKGSYLTNEMDDDDDDSGADDGESIGSDTVLQSRAPLRPREDE